MQAQRFDSVDALRGLAIVWMTLFHFSFDLNHYGFVKQNFYSDPFWTGQRTAIVSLFLFCAGLGQAIAVQQAQSWQRFGKRWAQVAACAVLVTAGSLVMFPNSYIYFGVLHGIALMLIIVRLTAGWGQWLWLAGAVALGLKFLALDMLGAGGALSAFADLFNSRALNWLGLISRKPIAEDYVPLIPWLGVMWWGMAAGQWALKQRPGFVKARPPKAAGPLCWLGRWSLAWYMLHQPVLIALVAAAAAFK